MVITLLDYGAGNVRSVINALEGLGVSVRTVQGPEDIASAKKLIFPGVGNFGISKHKSGLKHIFLRCIFDYFPRCGTTA